MYFLKGQFEISDPKTDLCRYFPLLPANEAGFSLTEVTRRNTKNDFTCKAHLLSDYIKLQKLD